MINFRFHLVSLTAVLLALGIGLLLGTAFIDDALIRTLRTQLDGLEGDLDQERDQVSEQRGLLDVLEEEHELLDEELATHVVEGSLFAQPVLVVTTEGVDDAVTERVLTVLEQADADVLGTWVLSAALNLDDEDSVTQLAEALDVPTDDEERLRDNVLGQLSDVLYAATDASDSADPDARSLTGSLGQPGQPADEPESDEGESSDERHEPDLLTRLLEADFVSYVFGEGSDTDVVELPSGGLRVVVVDDPGSEVSTGVLVDLLEGVASNGPVPVVATGPGAFDETDEDGEDSEDGDPALSPLIAALREHGELAERISTVDNLERVAGKVSTVLAAGAAAPGEPHIGSYGQSEGAERLLPPRGGLEETGE